MNWLELLGFERRVEEAKKSSPQERYARVEIDLGVAENVGRNIKLKLEGEYLTKIKYTGTAYGCSFKFDNKRSSIIYASEFRKRQTPLVPFKKIYLTNETAQPGKVLIFFVGDAISGEVEPALTDEITDSRRIYETESLYVDTTGEEDLLTPSTGKALEILGFNLFIAQRAPTGVSGGVTLMIKNDDNLWQSIFRLLTIGDGVGDNTVHTMAMSGLAFKAGVDRPLELKNMNWGGGTSVKTSVTIFYREV